MVSSLQNKVKKLETQVFTYCVATKKKKKKQSKDNSFINLTFSTKSEF